MCVRVSMRASVIFVDCGTKKRFFDCWHCGVYNVCWHYSMSDVPYKYYMMVSPLNGKLYISDYESRRIIQVQLPLCLCRPS